MAAVKKALLMTGLVAFLVLSGVIFVKYYPFIFSRKVKGVIVKVERVQLNVALMQSEGQGSQINPQLYSFAIAIKEPSGEIMTASAEDRQWAVAQPGQCVEAVYYPYPPWKFEKANTYYGARLERLFECQGQQSQ